MSSYDSQPNVDPEKIRRLFSHPLQFPPEFKTWMLDQLTLTVPDLPVGQAFGGSNLAKQLKHDATDVNATAAGVDTSVFSCDVPAGAVGQNGRIIVDSYFIASCGDASNQGHIKLFLGGVQLADVRLNTAFLDGNLSNGMVRWIIENANSRSAQRVWAFSWIAVTGTPAGTPADGAIGTGAIDMNAKQALELKVQWRDAGSQSYTHKLTSAQVYNPVAAL